MEPRARVRIFFFGLGYCARRLIQREPWIEASGTDGAAVGVSAGVAVGGPDDGAQERYAARLRAEVRGHGRWHGLR